MAKKKQAKRKTKKQAEMEMVDLSSLSSDDDGMVLLSADQKSTEEEMKKRYESLMQKLEVAKSEQDKGLLCKKFAELIHGLVFTGFCVSSGRPLFHMTK